MREKNLGSGFGLAFMFLLPFCVFLLFRGQEGIAEQVADWAYLFLVIGVVVELVLFFKERKG